MSSKTLVHVDKVERTSLPRSLRHYNEKQAIEQAIQIMHALRICTLSITYNEDGTWANQREAAQGIELITELVIDKLEIAGGFYKFPFETSGDNIPDLCDRIGTDE
jgi:hypothetical protein